MIIVIDCDLYIYLWIVHCVLMEVINDRIGTFKAFQVKIKIFLIFFFRITETLLIYKVVIWRMIVLELLFLLLFLGQCILNTHTDDHKIDCNIPNWTLNFSMDRKENLHRCEWWRGNWLRQTTFDKSHAEMFFSSTIKSV